MYGAPELEVAADADRHVVESALDGADGHQVGERLGRMLMSAVTRVDDRDLGDKGGNVRCTLLRMADRCNISETGDDTDRVRYTLALRGRARSGRRKAKDLTT